MQLTDFRGLRIVNLEGTLSKIRCSTTLQLMVTFRLDSVACTPSPFSYVASCPCTSLDNVNCYGPNLYIATHLRVTYSLWRRSSKCQNRLPCVWRIFAFLVRSIPLLHGSIFSFCFVNWNLPIIAYAAANSQSTYIQGYAKGPAAYLWAEWELCPNWGQCDKVICPREAEWFAPPCTNVYFINGLVPIPLEVRGVFSR